MLRFCLAGEYPSDVNKIAGGVQHVLYLLGETFAERKDIEFHLVAYTKAFAGKKVVEKPGMTIHYVGAPARRLIPNALTQGARIAPVLRGLKPDVVNSHHSITTDAALRAGCRVVHTIHGVIHKETAFASGKRKATMLMQGMMERRAVSRADALIAVAQYGLDSYARWIRSPAYVVHVPIEDVFWQVPPLERCKGILFVGAVVRRKNLETLVRAMPAVTAKHPDAVLKVCGSIVDRAYMAGIESFIRDNHLGGAVNFAGVVDRGVLADLLAGSVCLVLPSRQETAPGVIAQAMAAGRIVVASPVGGIPEMIEDGVTGFLVGPDDIEILASRLTGLLDDFDRAREVGDAARRVALQRYDRHSVADRILQICASVVAKRLS